MDAKDNNNNVSASGMQSEWDGAGMRRRSVSIIEFQDSSGRRKTVQLDELNAADRALAEQFGYKPVSVPRH
jgi:hypothetical protein